MIRKRFIIMRKEDDQMETRNLYRDNKRVVEAAFHNGELLYTVTYFFDEDLSVGGRAVSYTHLTLPTT